MSISFRLILVQNPSGEPRRIAWFWYADTALCELAAFGPHGMPLTHTNGALRWEHCPHVEIRAAAADPNRRHPGTPLECTLPNGLHARRTTAILTFRDSMRTGSTHDPVPWEDSPHEMLRPSCPAGRRAMASRTHPGMIPDFDPRLVPQLQAHPEDQLIRHDPSPCQRPFNTDEWDH